MAPTAVPGTPRSRSKTARAEVAFHKAQELEEIGWTETETFTFDDYLADFRADFHDIRGDSAYADCLKPDGLPRAHNAWPPICCPKGLLAFCIRACVARAEPASSAFGRRSSQMSGEAAAPRLPFTGPDRRQS